MESDRKRDRESSSVKSVQRRFGLVAPSFLRLKHTQGSTQSHTGTRGEIIHKYLNRKFEQT